ncbi:hypothetical protein Tco_0051972 [Tanacetum coccineum]
MATFLDEIIRPDNESTQTTGPQPHNNGSLKPTPTTSSSPTSNSQLVPLDNEFKVLFSRATDKLYPVNGVKFLVHDRDIHRTTQSSGVVTPGPNGEMVYGQLEEILKITYIGNRKGINHILTDKDSYRDQQYILATHARQVFYLEDPARRPPHWKVLSEDVHHHERSGNRDCGDLDYTILSTNDESTEVDAPPDNEVPDEESADLIGDEDDVVPHVLEDDDQDDDVHEDDDPASVHLVSSDDSSEDEN